MNDENSEPCDDDSVPELPDFPDSEVSPETEMEPNDAE